MCVFALFVYVYACMPAFLHVCGAGGQAGRAAEAGIIEAAVIKAVLIVLIGVINILRVGLPTHTETHVHRHLAHTVHSHSAFVCGTYTVSSYSEWMTLITVAHKT